MTKRRNPGARPPMGRSPLGEYLASHLDVSYGYTPDQIEFMMAMDRYKRRHGKVALTCREILMVAKGLGYIKE